jgi:hypothetical protein
MRLKWFEDTIFCEKSSKVDLRLVRRSQSQVSNDPIHGGQRLAWLETESGEPVELYGRGEERISYKSKKLEVGETRLRTVC